MSRTLALALTLWCLSGSCGREGNSYAIDPNNPTGPLAPGGGDGGADAGALADAASSTDLAPDMTVIGPTCGSIVVCSFQCGLTNVTCSTMCLQGTQGPELTKAGALVLCAATQCLLGGAGSDGGLGGLGGGGLGGAGGLQLLQCLSTNCQQQLANCDGLLQAGGL